MTSNEDFEQYKVTIFIDSPWKMLEVGHTLASTFLQDCVNPSLNEKTNATVSFFGAEKCGKSKIVGGCFDAFSGKNDHQATLTDHVRPINKLVTKDHITIQSADMGLSLMGVVVDLAEGNEILGSTLQCIKKPSPIKDHTTGHDQHIYLIEHPTILPLYTTDLFCLIGNPYKFSYSSRYFKGLSYYISTAIAHREGTLTHEAFTQNKIEFTADHRLKAEHIAMRLSPAIKNIVRLTDLQTDKLRNDGFKTTEDHGYRLVTFVLTSPYKTKPFQHFKKELLSRNLTCG